MCDHPLRLLDARGYSVSSDGICFSMIVMADTDLSEMRIVDSRFQFLLSGMWDTARAALLARETKDINMQEIMDRLWTESNDEQRLGQREAKFANTKTREYKSIKSIYERAEKICLIAKQQKAIQRLLHRPEFTHQERERWTTTLESIQERDNSVEDLDSIQIELDKIITRIHDTLDGRKRSIPDMAFIQEDLQEIKGVMANTIEELLNREDSLAALEEKADNLQVHSREFYKQVSYCV